MALTLECSCSPNITLCNLVTMTWHLKVTIAQDGPVAAQAVIILSSGVATPIEVFLNSPADQGDYVFDLHPLADWVDPVATIAIDSSLFQIGPGNYDIQSSDFIEQKYQCINVVNGAITYTIITANPSAGSDVQKCVTGTDTRSVCVGISGTLFKSTPLGACNGCSADQTDYVPSPKLDVTVDTGDGNVCLCATGGSGDYSYSIVAGNLACGQNLNPTTGCITGTPDGSCEASSSITFRVTDTGGADTGKSSGGQTIGGTANVFGSGATRLSGGQWTSDLVGQTITFGTASGVVASVADGDHLTLTTAIGIFSNVGWSYTYPVIPPPPPGPPEFAEVTCGYIQKCPSGIGDGNQAF